MPEMIVQSQNITFLYDSFSQDDIDPRQIKKLFEGQVIVNDFPEFSVFVWPDLKLIIQIGDRRFRITKHETGNSPYKLWDATQKANNSIGKPPIALGCNFDVAVKCEKSAIEIIRQIFSNDIDRITTALSGTLLNFVPRFKIAQDRFEYDFIIESTEDPTRQFVFHVNAHLEKPNSDDIANLDLLFTSQLSQALGMIDKFIKLGYE